MVLVFIAVVNNRAACRPVDKANGRHTAQCSIEHDLILFGG